jgi:uncharacterized lipoprotein
MRYFKMMSLAVITVSLTACTSLSNHHFFHSSEAGYKKADAIVAPTQVPTDLSAVKITNKHSVPAINNNQSQTSVSLIPPGSNLQQYEKKKVVQAVKNEPTAPAAQVQSPAAVITANGLVVQQSYPQVWDKTGKLLSHAGYPIMDKDNGLGNYYIVDKISTGGVLKQNTPIYQIHLERTGQNNTTITLLNSQNKSADTETTNRILGVLRTL